MDDKERLKVVLKHLIEHNHGHSEDHMRWIDLAKSAGMDDVARLLTEANDYAEKAGDAFKKALNLIP